MKFLFFTDSHLKTKTPMRRIGSYEDDVLAKIVYLLVTAQKNEVDFIVCGGDLFDQPNPSFRLASKVMKLIASSRIPWYQTLGNHEIIGHNPDSYDMGVLAFFEHLPNFNIVDSFESDDGESMRFLHYRHGIEEMSDKWMFDKEPSVLVAHAMITPTPVPFTHATSQTIKDYTDARLILLGHYHDPWANIVLRKKIPDSAKKALSEAIGKILSTKEEEYIEIEREIWDRVTIFLNPGSLARISLLAHNIRRTPRAIIVDIGEENTTIKAIPMKVAKKFDDVFKVVETQMEKQWEVRIEEFLAAMENVRVEGIEVSSLLINAAKVRAGVSSIDELSVDHKKTLDYALGVIGKLEADGHE